MLLHSDNLYAAPNLNVNKNFEPIRLFCCTWNPAPSPINVYQFFPYNGMISVDIIPIGIVNFSQFQPYLWPYPIV